MECKGLEIRPIRGGYMLTNQRRAGVWWGYGVQGARDSTNQRRVYVDIWGSSVLLHWTDLVELAPI